MPTLNSNLVSVEWLQQQLENPDLIILDATMKYLPNGEAVEPVADFIPGARGFDFDTEICDQATDLPHMLPSDDEFEQAVQELGINNNSQVVIYDAMGIFSAPRAWWMFRVFGHDNVAVLDGGLPAWCDAGYPLDKAFAQAKGHGSFQARLDSGKICSFEQVLKLSRDPQVQIIDARSTGRFSGQDPEPRQGVASGHISGSCCLPFTQLLEGNCYKAKPEIEAEFNRLVKADAKKLVFSCGSGVTACILALAADEIGFRHQAVYDGSWTEWVSRGMG